MTIAQKAPETVTAVNDYGDTSLSHCFTGESVDMLINLGADLNHRNETRRTSLHTAGMYIEQTHLVLLPIFLCVY